MLPSPPPIVCPLNIALAGPNIQDFGGHAFEMVDVVVSNPSGEDYVVVSFDVGGEHREPPDGVPTSELTVPAKGSAQFSFDIEQGTWDASAVDKVECKVVE